MRVQRARKVFFKHFFCQKTCVLKKSITFAVAKPKCPGGGIGRRARFRCVCREVCGFESRPGHHLKSLTIRLIVEDFSFPYLSFCETRIARIDAERAAVCGLEAVDGFFDLSGVAAGHGQRLLAVFDDELHGARPGNDLLDLLQVDKEGSVAAHNHGVWA